MVLHPCQALLIDVQVTLHSQGGGSHLTDEKSKTQRQSHGWPGLPSWVSQIGLICPAPGLMVCLQDLSATWGSSHLEMQGWAWPLFLHL